MRAPSSSVVWLALASSVMVGCESTAPEEASTQPLPPPALDLPAPADGALQIAVLAGGCFWGVEAVFEHLKGVVDVVSGYSGGTAETARYDLVVFGKTSHAESVQVRFDPREISYGQILRVYFSVAHDPTQVDRQDPDIGPEYRSNIFFVDEAQENVARAYAAQLNASGAFSRPIATRIDPLEVFYPAEDYHQNYLVDHLWESYIVTYDLPRLARLQLLFPSLYEPL